MTSTEAQIGDLIAALGHDTGTFITLTPASENQDWYASVSLLPDGTTRSTAVTPPAASSTPPPPPPAPPPI